MSSETYLPPRNVWYSSAGSENDCVVSSRVRLSRNLTDHLYQPQLNDEEAVEIQEEIGQAFQTAVLKEAFQPVPMGDITQLDRRVLMERNVIPQEYTMEKQRTIFLHHDSNIAAVTHDMDHVRLVSFAGGLNLQRAYEEVNNLDRELEKELDYAVSLDLGYLSTEVANLGTGMRVSTMLHLPALTEAELIDKAVKAIVQIGLGVKGFWGDEQHSLGNMYQIANTVSFGLSEKELIEKLENVTYQIVNYERRVREELAEKRRLELEDRIFRAYGILSNCRVLTAKEAIQHLLDVRFGTVLGWVQFPMDKITELLFLCQTAHMQKYLGLTGEDDHSKIIDIQRAEMVRNAILSKE